MAFSPRTPADEAWRKQLHAAHIKAKLATMPLQVLFYDGRTQTEVMAVVLSAHATYDDFVVRLEDGVNPCKSHPHGLPALNILSPGHVLCVLSR
jgi:hypothetical protein